jgi:hypothetical protein
MESARNQQRFERIGGHLWGKSALFYTAENCHSLQFYRTHKLIFSRSKYRITFGPIYSYILSRVSLHKLTHDSHSIDIVYIGERTVYDFRRKGDWPIGNDICNH